MATKQEIALAVLAGTEGLYAMSAFLPSLMTINEFGVKPQAVAALRRGEVVASAFAVIIGVTTSIVADSSLPIIFTVLGLVAAIGIYEWQIRHADGQGSQSQNARVARAGFTRLAVA